MSKSPAVEALLAEKRTSAEALVDHIEDGVDLIIGPFNAEPVSIIDAIEARADRFDDVRIQQMGPLRERGYIRGERAGLRHVSWFLTPADREAFHRGTCDLVPNNFSDIPALLRRSTTCSMVLASAAPPD